jgi:tetratricopeptide (TPR) repeat protein
VHHPVSTDNAAAQFAFDRGLTMQFAYQPAEAELAFRQAARLDPALAMAWWGIGLSLGPNINEQPTPEKTATAAGALARATLLAAKGASDSERDYIAALNVRYTSASDPDFDQLTTSYRDQMRALVHKYPEDADARALFAEAMMDVRPWRLWNTSGDPETGTQELVENIEHGLAAQPNHLGLLHFYIHAVEASNDPSRAFPAAHRLAALPMEPAAAHLVHMPAHIYMRVGDWEAAVEANEHATHDALDYRLSNNPKTQRACGHCADFLSYAYMMRGNEAHAREAAENYQRLNDDPSNAIAVLVRFRKWDEVLSFPEPGEELKTDAHDAHALRGFWHFARGLAFTAKRRSAQSQAELDALRSEAALAPVAVSFDGPPDVRHVLDKIAKWVDVYDLKIAAAILGSRIAEAQRRMPQAIDLMRSAVKLQDEMPYSEPPPLVLSRPGEPGRIAATKRDASRVGSGLQGNPAPLTQRPAGAARPLGSIAGPGPQGRSRCADGTFSSRLAVQRRPIGCRGPLVQTVFSGLRKVACGAFCPRAKGATVARSL